MIALPTPDLSSPRGGTKPLVICVDDEPGVLAALQRVLRREPYETIATEDPGRVLELVGQRPVSLVVADQRMPSMSGTQLLKAVRRESPATLGLILSGHATFGDIDSALDDGTVVCFVPKPWDDSEFRTEIRRLLHLEGVDRSRPRTERPRRPSVGSPPRTALRVDCSRLDCAEILAGIEEYLRQSEPPLRRAALVLENLGLVKASLSRFLSEVIHALVRSASPVALVEESGIAADFIRFLGEDLPFVLYSRESELPQPRRVLLVGTFDSVRFLPRRIASAGHSCVRAGTVSQAIRQMLLRSFDAVLLGRLFLDGTGVDLARRVMERLLDAPVFVLPEHATTGEILEAIRHSRRRTDSD